MGFTNQLITGGHHLVQKGNLGGNTIYSLPEKTFISFGTHVHKKELQSGDGCPQLHGAILNSLKWKNLMPSGKHTKNYWKLLFIVDLPIKNCSFHSYVSLLEGNWHPQIGLNHRIDGWYENWTHYNYRCRKEINRSTIHIPALLPFFPIQF